VSLVSFRDSLADAHSDREKRGLVVFGEKRGRSGYGTRWLRLVWLAFGEVRGDGGLVGSLGLVLVCGASCHDGRGC